MKNHNTWLDATARIGGIAFVVCMLVMVIAIFFIIIADSIQKYNEKKVQRKSDVNYVNNLFASIEEARSDFN